MSLTANQQVIQSALGGVVTAIQGALTTIDSAVASCTQLGATKTAADLTALKTAIVGPFAIVQEDQQEVNDIGNVS